MIIDYKNYTQGEYDFIEKNICGEFCLNEGGDYKGLTFSSFPNLHINDSVVTDCVFEHCGAVLLNSCSVEGCTFDDVTETNGNETTFEKCDFKNCHAESSVLIIEGYGEVEQCNFTNNSAKGDDGYIIYSVFSKKSDVRNITDCCFEKCTVENEEDELSYCAYFLPLSSTKTNSINNFDYDTCVIKN